MTYLTQLFDYVASRYLARRGAQNRRADYPSVAVFAFDRIGHLVNLQGRYEGAELACCVEFLRSKGMLAGIAVDVGANVGNHALFFAQHFAQVVALEPNPRVFELLAINARLRTNVRPLNVGASDVAGEFSLNYDTSNWGGGQISEESRAGGQSLSVRVSVAKLDDLPELADQTIGLLKVDVEGHELRVLQGAESLIVRSRPVVLFEQQAEALNDGSSPAVEWLRTHGYESFFEIRSLPGVPRRWRFPGRMAVNGVLRLLLGERRRVVPVPRFESVPYPMIIAVPSPAGSATIRAAAASHGNAPG